MKKNWSKSVLIGVMTVCASLAAEDSNLAFFLEQELVESAGGCEEEIVMRQAEEAPPSEDNRCPSRTEARKADWFVQGSFLYWQSEVSGVPSGLAWKGGAETLIFQPLEYHFQWQPGFQAAVGYCFRREDYPTLQINWTHMHGQGVSSVASKAQEKVVIPDLGPLSFLALSYRSRWILYYDLLDLGCTQTLFSNPFLSIVPQMSIRGAKISQHIRLPTYVYVDTDLTPVGGSANYFAKCSFSGIGPRFESAIRCGLSEHWNLVGCISGSFLRGRFSMNQKIHTYNTNPAGYFSIPNSIWRNQLNWEGKIGFEWSRQLFCDLGRISWSAFYEMSYWPRMFRLSDLIGGGPGGPPAVAYPRDEDISLQGLTTSLAFYF